MEDREAGMNDAEVELDQCFSVWCNDAFNGIKVLYFLGVTGRFNIGILVEELSRSYFPEGSLVSRTFALLMII